MRSIGRKAAVAAALLFALCGPAHAACRLSATGVAFGAYDVFASAPADSTGTVTISCDQTPPADAVVSIGVSPTSGGFNPRQMRQSGGADRLDYNLFTSPSMSTVWGDGTGGTSPVRVKNINRNRPVIVTIHGRIPPGQNASVGSYSETLTVTVLP